MRWTAKDVEVLRSRWRMYGPRGDASTARKLGRTVAAVRRERERLGLKDRKGWKVHEERYLRRRWELWEGDVMDFDARTAEILNRTIGSVKARRQALGLIVSRRPKQETE